MITGWNSDRAANVDRFCYGRPFRANVDTTAEAKHPFHSRRQHRLWGHRSLRRWRAARCSNPRIDRVAAKSLRLTQFLVEPSCTPSRAALMTGRYSIRTGLSLVAVPGIPFSLPAREITMAEMLRDAGYATAIFGKWHLGAQPYSQPQNKGFDEFYGIPPADTWDAFGIIRQGRQTKALDLSLDKGPHIVRRSGANS